MVQVFADPASPLHTPHTSEDVWRSGNGHYNTATAPREDQTQRSRDLMQKRGIMTRSRRGWSISEHQQDAEISNVLQSLAEVTIRLHRPLPVPEDSPLPSPTIALPSAPKLVLPHETLERRRPRLPPPRRSYTVMDYEPMLVNVPRPSSKFTLLDLPSEIHYAFFDFLDPIDGACFGLAHSRLYDIHCRKNGKVALSSRYNGPNDREWAWRGAGVLINKDKPKIEAEAVKELERSKINGQMYCRKCGVSRCELSRHLKDWMGDDYEYCEVKQIYGKPAGPHAKSHCYLSSPKDRHKCGRHGARKTAKQVS